MPANLHANLDGFALARAKPGAAGAAAYPDRTKGYGKGCRQG